MPSASSQLLNSTQTSGSASSGISSGGSASSKLIQGSQVQGSRFNQPAQVQISTPNEPVEVKKPGIFERLPSIFGKVKNEAIKFGARTAIEGANLVTSTADVVTDFLSKAIEREIRTLPTPKKMKPVRNQIADKWKSFYETTGSQPTEKLKNFTQELSKIEFIQPSKEWSEASNKVKFTTKLPETILNIGPGIVSSLGAFAINPGVGFAVSAGSVADEVRTIAVDNGVSDDRAMALGLGTGLLVGWIDKIVPDEVFSPSQKKQFVSGFAKRIVKIGLKEAGTEVVQEDIQLLAEATVREDLKKDEIITRNLMSGLGGLLGGSGISAITTFTNSVRNGDIGGEDGSVLPGEHTPQEILNKIVNSPIQDTEEGKKLIKEAIEAQKQGKNIVIEVNDVSNVKEETQVQPELDKLSKEAIKFKSAKDFAKIQGTVVDRQIGVLDANKITPRDEVDKTTASYKKLVEDIKKNGIIDPVIVKSENGKIITFEGSHRVTIAQDEGIKVPVIVNQGTVEGLQTIQEFYDASKIQSGKTKPLGASTTLPKFKTSIKSPSDLDASLDEPSDSTINISKPLGLVKSTNQVLSSNRKKFLRTFDMVTPSNSDYTKYYKELKVQESNFTKLLNDVSSKVDGLILFRVKTLESLKRKLNRKNKTGTRTLATMNDSLAGTILSDDIDSALKIAKEEYNLTNISDFRDTPTFLGYGGVHTDVELPNGTIAELQFNTLEGAYRKDYAHTIYDKWRKYIENNGHTTYKEVLNLVPEKDRNEFIADVKLSNDIYEGKVEIPQKHTDFVNDRIQENNQVKKETKPLKGILDKKKAELEKLAKKPQPTKEPTKKPVKPTKEPTTEIPEGFKQSRVIERVMDTLRSEVDLNETLYKTLTLDSVAKEAVDIVNKTPKLAQDMISGAIPVPETTTQAAISIAAAEQARKAGDFKIQKDLIIQRSFRQTRLGQEIVTERLVNDLSSDRFIRDVLKVRMDKVIKKVKKDVSRVKAFSDKVSSQARAGTKKINKKVLSKIESAQKIIDDLKC